MEIKKDCFAAIGENTCAALNEPYCKQKDKCRFYKTLEQVRAERKRSYDRLISLGCDTETAKVAIAFQIKEVKERRRSQCTGV